MTHDRIPQIPKEELPLSKQRTCGTMTLKTFLGTLTYLLLSRETLCQNDDEIIFSVFGRNCSSRMTTK
jgi:hypothetical protein